jgi:sugar-specific transcriptional regulator TrmB
VIAFRSFLRQEELALKAKQAGIEQLNREHERLEKSDVPPHFAQVLRGRQIKNFIDDLAERSETEVLIFTKSAEDQSAKSVEGAARSEIGMLERGVRVRCIYEPAVIENQEVFPVLERLRAAGEDSRIVPSVPMNMMVFDARAALFSLTEPSGGLTVFAFTHPDLVRLMKNSFEYTWGQGKSLRQALRKHKRKHQAQAT